MTKDSKPPDPHARADTLSMGEVWEKTRRPWKREIAGSFGEAEVSALNAWIKRQPGRLTEAEAITQLVREALGLPTG